MRCSVVVLQGSQIRRSIVAATNSGVSLTLALEAEHWGCVGVWVSCFRTVVKHQLAGLNPCSWTGEQARIANWIRCQHRKAGPTR